MRIRGMDVEENIEETREEKCLAKLSEAETIITRDILGNAINLLEELSFNKNKTNNIVNEEDTTETKSKYFDLDTEKLDQIGENYLSSIEKVSNILIENISKFKAFKSVAISNYGLRKDLEILKEREFLLKGVVKEEEE